MKKDQILTIIALTFVTSVVIYPFIKGFRINSIIAESGKVTIGQITNINRGPTKKKKENQYFIDYTFSDKKNNLTTGQRKFDFLSKKDEKLLSGKKFPIIYLPFDTKKNRILLNKKDFTKYNVEIPDSLQEFSQNFKAK